METIIIDGNSYYLPESISDVQELINQAINQKTEIRVRGASHSVQKSIYPDTTITKPAIFVSLSKMRSVQFQKVTLNGVPTDQVVVEGGCNLGYDPFDPTRISTWTNSLFYQLDQKGFAVPDMGGIIHQAVGGFISTGSSGGSTTYSFNDALYSITFIPANALNPEPITVNRDDADPDLFNAIGVSMGLLGIIVSVTFNLIPKFNIKGTEITSPDDQTADFDFLGTRNDKSLMTFQDFLQSTEYTRVIWYPQNGIRKLTVWKAARMQPDEPFERNPYYEFAKDSKVAFMEMLGIDIFYTLTGTWPNWWNDIFGNEENLTPEEKLELDAIKEYMETNYWSTILPKAINFFVPNNMDQPKNFMDYWYSSLPMDNNVSDTIVPVEFTELWIDINDTAAVMTKLNQIFADYYAQACPGTEGSFNTEIYAAKACDFWLSPSYKRDVVRIDVFWWGNNNGLPSDSFYPIFWNGLKEFNYRCHWGKYMPKGDDPNVGFEYVKQQYPKLLDFLSLREKYDPNQIFVNDYWRGQLMIQPVN